MDQVSVTDRSSGVVLAVAWVAASRSDRRRGLLGTTSLAEGEGLLIRRCRSVHTIGMAYSLDVLFLAGDGRVVKATESLPPGRITWPVMAARDALELPAGTVARSGTQVGDIIEFHPPGA